MNRKKLGKAIWVAGVIFVGLTAAMNLLGGIGTTCAAFFTKQYPPMWSLLDYQWLYQSFVVVSVIIGLAGIWFTVAMARGGAKAYRNTLILMVIGTIVAGIHMYASLTLRGAAVPANVKLYLNLVTLLLLLAFQIPAIKSLINDGGKLSQKDRAKLTGMTAIIGGLITLSTPLWVGPTHIYNGENWVYVLALPLVSSGLLFTLGGAVRLVRAFRQPEAQAVNSDETPIQRPVLQAARPNES